MMRRYARSFALGTVAALGLLPMPANAQPDCEDITPVHAIQGQGHVSPLLGEEVATCGVVTATFFSGYYVQDPDGDGDPNTSDGLFVRQFGSKPDVGSLVHLIDTVEEDIPGGESTGNLSVTRFNFPITTVLATEQPLPDPVIIGRGGRIPPAEIVISDGELPVNLQDPGQAAGNFFNPDVDGIDYYESLEGMLVEVPAPVAVSAIRQFGNFSAEVFVLADDGADAAPRDARTRRGGINLQPDPDNRGDQNPERVQIQFDGSTGFPPITVGDRLSDVIGTVGYGFGNFEVNTVVPVEIVQESRIGPETAKSIAPPRLTVATYNVLNLSATSNDDAQRALIAEQITENLRAPDIIALQEVQDNNGDIGDCPDPDNDLSPCSNVLDATETLQALVDAIVAAGGPTYAFFTVDPLVETTDDNRDDPDAFGGIARGNIRNAFLYNDDRVDLVPESVVGLTRDELEARGVTEYRAFDTSRDPLQGTFAFNGREIIIINNHFSSRFGSSPVFGGPQPFFQAAEEAREAQSLAMNQLVNAYLDGNADANIVVLGDLNTFEFTDDLSEILPGRGSDRVLRRLSKREDDPYTFIFEGNSQNLDHIFVTRALGNGAQTDTVHVNVDFPRRFVDVVGSDHEPIVTGLVVNRGR